MTVHPIESSVQHSNNEDFDMQKVLKNSNFEEVLYTGLNNLNINHDPMLSCREEECIKGIPYGEDVGDVFVDLETLAGADLVDFVRYEDESFIKELFGLVGSALCAQRFSEARDERGNSVMHMCAANGQTESVNIIASLAPELVSVANLEGNSPMHWACVSGHLPIVSLLHNLGAPTAVENSQGRTPICEAQLHERHDILDFFISILGRKDENYDNIYTSNTNIGQDEIDDQEK
jgi:hypothetical protein